MFAIMSRRQRLLCVHVTLVASLCPGAGAYGQLPTPPTPRVRPPAPTAIVFVRVRDDSGRRLGGVRLALDGVSSGEFVTDDEGVVRLRSVRDGAYHLRFEKAGFASLEREVTIRRGEPDVIDVVLIAEAAPEAPPAPPPALPATPLQLQPRATPSPVQAGTVPPPPTSGEPTSISILGFLDRNFIGRDPLRESILGCTSTAKTRLLQLRDGIAEHSHADADEVIYVVAGEGALLFPGREATPVGPGSLSIVPRGSRHAIQRRSKSPLVVLSVLSGAPCQGEAVVGK